MKKYLAWVRRRDNTPEELVSAFNVYIAKPDKQVRFLGFIRDSIELACHNGLNQATKRYRSVLDLFLAKNVAEDVAELITVYHSDREAIVTAFTLKR